MNSLLLTRIKLRTRYRWKRLCNFFGFCPCGGRVNFTTSGRAVCIECDRATR